MSYTTPSELVKNYPKLFSFTDKNLKDPNDYLRNPEKLANLTMCCSYGNNGIAGAGWKYRGRGPLQLTWHENYEKFQRFYNKMFNTNWDFVKNPDLVNSNAEIAMISALWFFQTRVINKISIGEKTTVKSVTRIVNGGYNDLDKREVLFGIVEKNIDCNN